MQKQKEREKSKPSTILEEMGDALNSLTWQPGTKRAVLGFTYKWQLVFAECGISFPLPACARTLKEHIKDLLQPLNDPRKG